MEKGGLRVGKKMRRIISGDEVMKVIKGESEKNDEDNGEDDKAGY